MNTLRISSTRRQSTTLKMLSRKTDLSILPLLPSLVIPVRNHTITRYFKLIPFSGLDHKHQVDLHKFVADIPASHPRHARLFPVEQIERTENWNPDEPSGVSWVKELPKLVSFCPRRF